MPAVDQVELNRDHVANAGRSAIGVVNLIWVKTGVESPGGVHAVKVDDSTKIVIENKVDVEATSD